MLINREEEIEIIGSSVLNLITEYHQEESSMVVITYINGEEYDRYEE